MAMAKIRKIEIKNFRSIKSLTWLPLPGVNCLIGPGDIGKSTILDAIDLCLGARRSISISDADFHSLDIGCAISITLTLGDLEDSLKSIEAYGIYFQAFNSETGEVLEEPKRGLETVLNLNLTINDDLEPEWSLVSGRATSQGLTKNIAWKDRVAIAPMRLGSYENSNFSWSKGSVLNRLSDQKIEAGELLAQVAREARNTFGAYTDEQLSSTLALVIKAANELGVEIGDAAKAMLDVRSVSFTNGAISLHDNNGVPSLFSIAK
jgi:predicted ATP-dependent endonuclease of OLD family